MGGSERRREERLEQHFRVRLVMWDKYGEAITEDTVTENVSRKGAAVHSRLPLQQGRILQLIRLSQTKSFVVRVRARSLGQGKGRLLHLQFVNQEWPLNPSH